MKIYFAYRTGYKANHRFIKEFEADSILDFFQKHWQQFAQDEEPIIGSVYGFPFYYDKEEGQTLQTPANHNQLIELLQEYVYCNEILGDEACIEVHTDDDEIELAWYVFTEDYKNANMDKIALWFYDVLPTSIDAQATQISKITADDCLIFSDKTTNCYLMSSAIYDGSNLEDMQFIKLQGTSVKTLIDDVKRFDFDGIKEDDYLPYVVEELHIIKSIATQFNVNDLNSAINILSKYSDLIANDTGRAIDWKKLSINDEADNSFININEYIAEFGIYDGFCFHYYILFDDVWANTYPELAKSIMQFGQTYHFSQTDLDD